MKKIILATTDFSAAAENAVNYAADMALAINAEIFLLHIYQLPVSYSEVPVPIDVDDICEDYEKEIKNLKQKLIVRTHKKVTIHTEVRKGVFFNHELESACELLQPYAVVMGSQGKTAATHLLFGNHAAYALTHLMWPLITVPPHVNFSSINKIGLACDLIEVGTIPIDEIKILVKNFKAKLHVLNIDKENVFNPKTDFQSVLLEQMLASLKPEYHFIYNKNTDKAIIEFVEKNKIDLLIVLPKLHSLINALIHKSHSKQLVLHSHVPIMALHPI